MLFDCLELIKHKMTALLNRLDIFERISAIAVAYGVKCMFYVSNVLSFLLSGGVL